MASFQLKIFTICLLLTLILAQNNSTDSNGTAPPPGNGTNGTNGTLPPPPANSTNGTNGTAPPPNNSTNNTAPPANGTNNGTMNGTNGNGTVPPPANGTNSTAPTPANMTFAPPPPINTTVAVVLNASGDGRLILSKRIQSLELMVHPANGSANVSTDFKLNSYNRNSPGGLDVARLNLPGNWSYVSGTQDTLSCNLIFQSDRGIYGLLQFLSESGTLRLVGRDFLRSLTNQTLPVPNASSAVILRQNCNGFYFNNVLYTLPPAPANASAPNGTNNTANNMTVNATIITVPAGWNPRSTPESLQYAIANNILYRFNPNGSSYTNIYSFPPNQAYDIRSWKGRVLVVGANATTNNSITQINQAFYILNDQQNGIQYVGQFFINGGFPTNISLIPYLASPQLTKIGAIFPNAGNASTPTVINLKTIDYSASTISNLTFQDVSRLQATIRNLRPDNMDFYFGDNYYVVRNASAGNATNGTNASLVEQAYQFVGSQVTYLRDRLLDGRELTDFRRMWVDLSFPNQLVVLDAFDVPNALEINEFIYGSLASINKVVPPTTPPFITFQIPPHSSQFMPKDDLVWFYLNSNPNATNATDYTVFSANPDAPNNIQVVNASALGNIRILTLGPDCFMFVDTLSNNVTFASAPPANGTAPSGPNNTNGSNNTNNSQSGPFVYQNVTPLLANLSINNQSKWTISEKCDRFAVNNMVFFRTPNNTHFRPVQNNMTEFNASSLDRGLNGAIVNSSIWLFNPNTTSYFRAFNFPRPVLPNSMISVSDNRVVVTATNGTTAQVLAFLVEPSGNFTNCLDFMFPMYQNAPKIQLSQKLTKVLVSGPFIPPNKTQVQPKYDAFFVNYANRTAQNITVSNIKLPVDTMNTLILLDQKYVYLRSLPNNGSAPNGTYPQEIVFFLDQDITPKIAKSSNLTTDQVNQWRRTAFAQSANNTFKYFVESVGGNMTDQVIVNMVTVTAQQANLNSNNNLQGVTGTVVNGVVKLCSIGCSDCSSGTCTGCQDNYAFDSSSSTCTLCGVNCKTCSSTNYAVCSSCIVGSYLNGSTCLACDRSCITCEGGPMNCTSCPPGQTSNNGSCGGCAKNCIACADYANCLACTRGFVLVNSTCRACASSCSNCSATNITECTSCANGLSLVNSACVACPDKCQSCNNGICTTCIPGYTPNTAGTCVLNCQLSCATCADNQPSVCLSCYSGASLVGSTCQFNSSCNSDSSCTDCGQGLGYVLVGSSCVQCPNISNCLQCDSTNSQQCAFCLNGYYINSSKLCSACSASCVQCVSSDICTACALGYTLADNQTQGQCLQCQSPCATCLGITTYCTSCVSGFTRRGWRCQNNTYVKFSFTISNAAPAAVLADVDNIVQRILTICGQNTTNVGNVIFDSIQSGSTVISGVTTTTSTSPTVASASLSSALASGALGNYTVVSSSVSAQGTDSSSDKPPMTGLIVGVVVGVVAVAVVAIVGYVMYQKKKKQTQPLGSQDGGIVIELSNQQNLQVTMAQPDNRSPTKLNNPASNAEQHFFQPSANAWEKEMIDS